MIKELRLACRAVARKGLVPELCHIRIDPDRVTGYNGELAVSVALPTGISAGPNANAFLKAVAACEEDVTFTVEDHFFLDIRSGDFSASLPCLPVSQLPYVMPEGAVYYPQGSILQALKVLEPFMGIDASRPWACGMLFSGSSAFATNNIAAVEYWLGWQLPRPFNIPSSAIHELVAVGMEPYCIQASDTSITFHYPDHTWIRTQLLDLSTIHYTAMLDEGQAAISEVGPQAFSPKLKEALLRLAKFSDDLGRVYLRDGYISTTAEPGRGQGARIELPESPNAGIWRGPLLCDVLSIATAVDFANYPSPAFFVGENIRGLLVGLRPT